MVFFSTTGLLLHVALFRLGTTHDCAIGQAGPSIWSRLPPALFTEVPMRRIGLAVVLALNLVAALAAGAQQTRKVYRIGILSPSPTPAGPGVTFDILRLGLRDLGYVEGENVRFEYRMSGGHDDRFPELASELVVLKVDVIIAATVPAIRATQEATTTIPVVMILSSDPVRMGLVKSLARPGGNTTGLASLTFDLSGKRVEALKEAVPRLSRVAILFNPTNPAVREGESQTNVAAQKLGLKTRSFEVRAQSDLETAFTAIMRERPDGLIVVPDPFLGTQAARVEEFAAKNRLPAIFGGRTGGSGLMSYGIDFGEHVRSAAPYVDKILRGANPADLPVEQPTKFEFVINLKTAKAIGLTIPQSLLVRADQIIE